MNYLLERLEEIGYPALILLVLGIVLAFGAKSFWERKGYEGEKLTQYEMCIRDRGYAVERVCEAVKKSSESGRWVKVAD